MSTKIVNLLEGIRKDRKENILDFISHFEIGRDTYWGWRKAASENRSINLPITKVQVGLKSLGYDYFIIMTKADK